MSPARGEDDTSVPCPPLEASGVRHGSHGRSRRTPIGSGRSTRRGRGGGLGAALGLRQYRRRAQSVDSLGELGGARADLRDRLGRGGLGGLGLGGGLRHGGGSGGLQSCLGGEPTEASLRQTLAMGDGGLTSHDGRLPVLREDNRGG
jgi:hypothetical protein